MTFVKDERCVLRVMLSEACAATVDQCDLNAGSTCVDCRGTCEPAKVQPSALTKIALDVDPLDSYVAQACTLVDAGAPGLEAGLDAAVDAATEDAGNGEDGAIASDASLDASTSSDAASDAASSDSGPPSGLRDRCTLLLHMNESQWSGLAGEVRDDSGQANHGSATGSAAIAASGRFGPGGRFDGSGWLEVPDAPSLRPSTALTVSAWFFLDQLPGTRWPGIVAKRIGFGSDSAFALFLSPENRVYVDVAGEESRFFSNGLVTTGRWYHVAFVFDGSLPVSERVKLYIDGALDTTASEQSDTIPAYTANVAIGNLKNGGETFIGRIDEVAMWTRALSASEVAALSSASSEL